MQRAPGAHLAGRLSVRSLHRWVLTAALSYRQVSVVLEIDGTGSWQTPLPDKHPHRPAKPAAGRMDCGHASGRKVSSILHDPRLQLSSVALRHVEPYFFPLVLRPLLLPLPAGENATRRHFLRHALVRLTADTAYRPYAMSDLILLLANCPNLQHDEVCNIAVDASQQNHVLLGYVSCRP